MYRLDKIQQKCNFYHNTYQIILFLSRTPFDKKGKNKRQNNKGEKKEEEEEKDNSVNFALNFSSVTVTA